MFFVQNLKTTAEGTIVNGQDFSVEYDDCLTYVRKDLFAFSDSAFSNNNFTRCLTITVTLTPMHFSIEDYNNFLNSPRIGKNKRQ